MQNSGPLEKLKVLIVDDNQHMRKLVGTILSAFGCRSLIEADCGERALRLVHVVRPDLIIVDYMMDAMDGVELTRRVRGDAGSPNPFVPILLLTGYTQPDKIAAARDAGVNEILAKPVSAGALYSRIFAIVEHPRPFVRTRAFFGPDRRRRKSDEYFGPERRDPEVKAENVQPKAPMRASA